MYGIVSITLYTLYFTFVVIILPCTQVTRIGAESFSFFSPLLLIPSFWGPLSKVYVFIAYWLVNHGKVRFWSTVWYLTDVWFNFIETITKEKLTWDFDFDEQSSLKYRNTDGLTDQGHGQRCRKRWRKNAEVKIFIASMLCQLWMDMNLSFLICYCNVIFLARYVQLFFIAQT